MYQSLAPDPQLAPYIECYWRWRSDALPVGEDLIFPDAVPEVLIHTASPPLFRIGLKMWNEQSMCSAVKLVFEPMQIRLQGQMDVFGIRFKPWGIRPFLSDNVDLTPDTMHKLTDVFHSDLSDASVALINMERSEDKVKWLNRKFLNVLSKSTSPDEVVLELNELVRGRMSTARDLASIMNKSPRSFSRLWSQTVGVQVRTFVRIMRLQEALSLIRAGQNLADISAMTGYSDQAHMNREVKSLCGLTPSQIRNYLNGETFEQFYVSRPNAPWLREA